MTEKFKFKFELYFMSECVWVSVCVYVLKPQIAINENLIITGN